MKFIGIIPARYASTRFPGKPLAILGGKPMIQRVYERASLALDEVWVATDDTRIADAVKAFGGNVVMTSAAHRSGTDRCLEAYRNIGSDADVVINIQGDEPFIDPLQLKQIQSCFDDPDTRIATLVRPYNPEGGIEGLENPNSPKVALDAEDMRCCSAVRLSPICAEWNAVSGRRAISITPISGCMPIAPAHLPKSRHSPVATRARRKSRAAALA